MKKLTHSGYFEGIGGFSLGASWAGIKTVYTCENHPLRHDFLKNILPKAKHEKDITEAKGKRADIFTAGFPCQDISQAGKGEGINGERSGLFFRFIEIVRLHRPKYVVLENAPVLNRRGLREILIAFTEVGYDAEWEIISKRAVGFEDERERCIIVAYPSKIGRHKSLQVFSSVAYKLCLQALSRNKQLESESIRTHSFALSEEAIRELLQCDDGLSPKLVQPYIEAYGDSIAPPVAQLIFEMIKIHYQFSRE